MVGQREEIISFEWIFIRKLARNFIIELVCINYHNPKALCRHPDPTFIYENLVLERSRQPFFFVLAVESILRNKFSVDKIWVVMSALYSI